ncbi:MAG: UDP-N-acetylmuramate--L-alanine ligase, partial [Hyphomicrobiaceae bacterium]
AELMRVKSTISVTGTHGKTTTTSLISHVLVSAGLDPTVITGGIITDWGSNARLGEGEWMIVEADESDGTFTRLPTQIGVVTNIDPEHLDYFGSVEAMHQAYEAFYANVPFYGLIVTCIDHPVVREMVGRLELRESGRRLLTYGVSEDADLRITNVRYKGTATLFDAVIGPRARGGARCLENVVVPVPGEHNAANAIAAIAVASEAGVEDRRIVEAIAAFSGVKRRFTLTGTWNGVAVFDDYAHHPVEIAAVLAAARRSAKGRVIAVVQPHRYSRVHDLFQDFSQCFADADAVLVAPIYSAGEAPIEGIDHVTLAEGIRRSGHPRAVAIDHEHDLAPVLRDLARPGDYVVVMGAGTNTDWAYALPDQLAEVPLRTGSAM